MPRLARLIALLILTAACGTGAPASMAIGSPAPAFSLPGTDGRVHSLADYAGSRVLVIVFTCNHCPASQLYEARLAKLYDDYRNRGVALVAINPDNPKALRLDEMSHTDVGESLDDMKTRAAHRRFEYPYLSDGEALAKQFKVVATPQIFVFDADRTLRYQGRIDDNQAREDAVTSRDARNAIEALLDGRSVPVAETRAAGCPPTFLSKPGGPEAEQAAIAAEPVTLEMVGADALKKLRQNGTGKLLLINFWATWCAPCVSEFPDLEATYRMYRSRNVDFVTVSTNDPEEKPGVLEFLKKHHASHRNLQFATSNIYELQNAFDPKMPAPVPFTLLLAPNGDVLYQELGASDIPKLRRAILASLPDDQNSAGEQAYWSRE
jgi:peroxiredoxin